MTQIVMSIPNTEVNFFETLAQRMGWKYSASTSSLDKLMAEGPCSVEISDEEIMNEVRAVRYAKLK